MTLAWQGYVQSNEPWSKNHWAAFKGIWQRVARWPHLQPLRIVVSRVLLVLALLEGAYLLLANLLLLTPLLRSLASSSDDLKVNYQWAVSPWPGRVEFSKLALRVQDYNIQAAIDVEHGQVDIDLLPLLNRKFHALWVDVQGVDFRMRHKLSKVGDQGPRLAGYPRIAEFSDPPLFVGPDPGPVSDFNNRLWEIQLQDVVAQLAQVWILEYRFRGQGVAMGGFLLRPGRYCEVPPSSLELNGSLSLAQTVVASEAQLHLEANVRGFDPRQVSGLEPFRNVKGSVVGQLDGMDLSFVNVYLKGAGGAGANDGLGLNRVTGTGALQMHLNVDNAELQAASALVLSANELSLELGRVRLRNLGRVQLQAARELPSAPLQLAVQGPGAVLEPVVAEPGLENPWLDGVSARLDVAPDGKPPLIRGAWLGTTRLSVPQLRWFKDVLQLGSVEHLSGRGTLEVQGERDGFARTRGRTLIELEGLALRAGGFGLRGGVHFDTRFGSSSEGQDALRFEALRLNLSQSTIALANHSTEALNAAFRSDDLTIGTQSQTRAAGTVQMHANRLGALLTVLSDSALVQTLPSLLLGDNPVDAIARFRMQPHDDWFELIRATSGAATVSGQVARKAHGINGAFLITTPVTNLGLNVVEGDVHLKFLVSNGWLKNAKRSSANAPPID